MSYFASELLGEKDTTAAASIYHSAQPEEFFRDPGFSLSRRGESA